jgi:hypothetical protein
VAIRAALLAVIAKDQRLLFDVRQLGASDRLGHEVMEG